MKATVYQWRSQGSEARSLVRERHASYRKIRIKAVKLADVSSNQSSEHQKRVEVAELWGLASSTLMNDVDVFELFEHLLWMALV